jgi:protein-disulfide isomerase
MRQYSKRTIKQLWYGLFGVVLIGMLAWGWYSQATSSTSSRTVEQIVAVQEGDHVVGLPTARVTLIEYYDLQCSACRGYNPIIRQLEKDYPTDLRVIRRYFPLPMHPYARQSAAAAEAAGMQGKYEEMVDLLLSKQDEWSASSAIQDTLSGYAASLGLNMDKFTWDSKSREVRARIARDQADANTLDLGGTPSFLLQGKTIATPRSLDEFKKLIEAEIAKLPKN